MVVVVSLLFLLHFRLGSGFIVVACFSFGSFGRFTLGFKVERTQGRSKETEKEEGADSRIG